MPNILLVEPDRMLAGIMQAHLKPAYEVRVCHDAQSAISAADERRPDAVVLELAIAEHNGIAFLQEFRSYTDWTKVPVIIYSQIPKEDTGLNTREWAKLGVASYLYKPTASLVDLSHAIERAQSES